MKIHISKLFVLVLFLVSTVLGQPGISVRPGGPERHVTVTRDDWGVAHVSGKTDADAVFGAIYAQAEDDFNRIETNYLNSMGRLAEAEGERAIWTDLRQRLFIDEEDMKKKYAGSPEWLKQLLEAWADGLNYFLATHPTVKPKVITRFEPWMPLTFSEGSIGGDIESVNVNELRALYDTGFVAVHEPADPLKEPSGSNGIAIAPANTRDGKALLLINPHTSFFFRSELHMKSNEGLNAYGASTWGQFFIYQGFNEHLGWMHTSSAVDAIDEYVETVTRGTAGRMTYKHGSTQRPVIEKDVVIRYTANGAMKERRFKTLHTHHGPLVRRQGDKLVAVALMNTPVPALMQSYGRTKAKTFEEFKKVMELQANSSNATLFADDKGNIAYFHPNFVPRRDPKFDWTKPVDGSDPATDWQGLLRFDELPNLKNPASGWVYNSNNWPWSAAGPSSLKRADFPRYVDNGVESARGRHAIRVLTGKKDFTLEKLNEAAYDSYLPWFETTVPALVRAWEALPNTDPRKEKTREQIGLLRRWNMRWAVDSIPTSLAIFWGEDVIRKLGQAARASGKPMEEFIAAATGDTTGQLVNSLVAASDRLVADFGSWRTKWGDINRFQRISPEIVHPFDDAKPSIPVGFPSGNWGSLASFGARPIRGTKKWYGTSGNSFVAVVEFGKKVRARAVTAGGESGDPSSPHFNDQAERYAAGRLRDVYFYPEDIKKKAVRSYRPGEVAAAK